MSSEKGYRAKEKRRRSARTCVMSFRESKFSASLAWLVLLVPPERLDDRASSVLLFPLSRMGRTEPAM